MQSPYNEESVCGLKVTFEV